ncbi:hypothetical protein [Sessilibacter corallicola]|uniref:hypothetical protein n=1 Tax=Sessilibacter corallicola TaxID=2904075 RepID=UPI001E56E8EE|nr:hypothetical protein [Sessilibacter corallicola]MCE2028240.1 hypothetical protein [Sessilibacter corallicola]
MFEIHRQAYLNALGIDNYVPRWQLPGATESKACEFIAPEVESDDESLVDQQETYQTRQTLPSLDQRAEEHTPLVTARSANEIIEQISANSAAQPQTPLTQNNAIQTPTEKNRQAPTPVVSPAPISTQKKSQVPSFSEPEKNERKALARKTTSENVSFSLSFWRISDDLMIVDSRQAKLALPTEKLLVNMLVALGYPKELPKSEIIHWPLIDAPNQPHDENAARETLNAFLDEQFLLRPGRFLLLMGEDAVQYLLDSQESFADKLNKTFTIDDFSLTAIVTHNLAYLLQNPESKADVWRAIQPLRQ